MHQRLILSILLAGLLLLAACNTAAPRSSARGRTLSPDREFGEPARLPTDSTDISAPDSLQPKP